MFGKKQLASLEAIENNRRITSEDVLSLRRDVFHDGVINIGEAERLIALNETCANNCPEWTEFYLEVLTDFTVHQATPRGHVSDQNADWLVSRISRDGKVQSATELELLVKVLETAGSAPANLATYALQQVADGVLHGSGPLAKGGSLETGIINAAEVHLIRRILHAGSGEAGLGISRDEAELLFKLNDATAKAGNDPAWNDLFVKSIANYVLGYSRQALASREQAARNEAFLDSKTPGVAGVFGGMASSGLSAMGDLLRSPRSLFTTLEDSFKALNESREAGAQAAEKVDAAEAQWLAARIGKGGELHDNERALLKFIQEITSDIHADLKPLIAKVA